MRWHRGERQLSAKTTTRGRAIVRGGRGAATRTLGLLGSIFQYGVRNGMVERNPVRGVEKFAYRRKSALSDPTQYGLLGQALGDIRDRGRRYFGAA